MLRREAEMSQNSITFPIAMAQLSPQHLFPHAVMIMIVSIQRLFSQLAKCLTLFLLKNEIACMIPVKLKEENL